MPVPAASTNNPRLRTMAILTIAVELLELFLITLQLTVLVIETAAPILCAPIYLLIHFTESLISDIGPVQIINHSSK
jgi:hypothetical protein